MTDWQASEAKTILTALLEEMDLITPGSDVLTEAERLAETHALRAHDAVHGATAVLLASSQLVAVTGDQELLAAWEALGLATVDTPGT
jgi:predicted nucleic acid-binding protein